MHLCGMDYNFFSSHCCKCNSFGCTVAIRCGNACHGPHSSSLYSGGEYNQFNSPRLVKREYIYIYTIDFPVSFIFFKFDFSAFLNFHTEIYCVILSSCTESGPNAVHRMTSLLINVFPNSGPMCGPWVTVGSLHKGPVIQRYICPRVIHFALFFLLTSVKKQTPIQ